MPLQPNNHANPIYVPSPFPLNNQADQILESILRSVAPQFDVQAYIHLDIIDLLEAIKNRTTLIQLELHNLRITDDEFMFIIASFPNLRSLKLWECEGLKPEHGATISRLIELEELYIEDATDEMISLIKEMKNLKSLYLERSGSLTDNGLFLLPMKFPNLVSLYVSGSYYVKDYGDGPHKYYSSSLSDKGGVFLNTIKSLNIVMFRGCDQVTTTGLLRPNWRKS